MRLREEYDRTRKVRGIAQRPAGMRARIAGLRSCVFAERPVLVGGDVAGGDGVHLHIAAGPFVGRVRLGQLRDAALGGRVSGHGDAALKAEQRCGEDNFAGARASACRGRIRAPA